jgi:hypothetical protein
LDCITPLRHFLDFFTLVNLMNQFRRVIDQPHGRFTRDPDAAQTIDIFLVIPAIVGSKEIDIFAIRE